MTTMTRADQATDGIKATAASGIVLVRDGADAWLCREAAYDAAIEALDALPAIGGDDGGALAYDELCSRVAEPIASRIGTSRGDYVRLARDAVDAGLIDEDDASGYGLA